MAVEGDVVDLRVGAPEGAAGDRDFELARQVVELRVRREHVRDFDGERRRVDEFVAVEAGERAAGDVPRHVSAGALGAEADCGKRLDDFGNGLDGEPVELDVLADGDVGEDCARSLQFADDA